MSDASHIPTSRKVSALAVDQLLVDEQTAVVSLAGDLDLWSAPHLKSTLCDLLADGRTRLVVDLERVGFMDSTALGVMIGMQHRFGDDERMVIAAAAPPVLRLLELSGLATGLRVFASRDDALSHMSEEPARAPRRASPPLTADAALMLGIASTAMPFARSAEDQAERWLRALRNHGESGAILASLGLSEAALDEPESEPDREPSRPGDPDAVATVTRQAGHIAAERMASKLGTIHVLLAVIDIYGPTFYRALSAHGVDPAELRARVATAEPAPAES